MAGTLLPCLEFAESEEESPQYRVNGIDVAFSIIHGWYPPFKYLFIYRLKLSRSDQESHCWGVQFFPSIIRLDWPQGAAHRSSGSCSPCEVQQVEM